MAPIKRLSSPKKYTIGWITALSLELAAARAALNEEHKKPDGFSKSAHDSNNYVWGEIGDHNVVIASLPTGRYGTVSASTTANHMRASLPHIRCCLLVGIGAGIPRLDAGVDIRLGDVVVSQPSGTSPGVIQYDLGKAEAGGNFKRTGALNKPPDALLNGLAALRAEHLLNESRMSDIHTEMLERYPKLKQTTPPLTGSFAYQGAENDRLFDSAATHVTAPAPSTPSHGPCSNCDTTKLISRPERSDETSVIHYGTIASGDVVVKDGVTRDTISERLDHNCLCLEMEAAGLMDNFPCLVIRGICDYADSHKNDRWQPYAAATAAAFARELLEIMDTDAVEQTATLAEALGEVNSKVDLVLDKTSNVEGMLNESRLNDHHKKVIDWLAPQDCWLNYVAAVEQRHEGSGSWLLSSQQYQAWKLGDRRFLWLHGPPGCGKTVLSSLILDDLVAQPAGWSNVLFFYFSFTDSKKQDLEGMVRTLIKQLYVGRIETRTVLKAAHDRPSCVRELIIMLRQMLSKAGAIWIVLDALDECATKTDGPTEGLLACVKRLVEDCLNAHILATSRSEYDIKASITKWARTEDLLHLRSHLTKHDIDSYIRSRVKEDNSLARWRSRTDVQDKIIKSLTEKANGIFRWAACQLDVLEQCLDELDLDEALQNLPPTLSQTYERILGSIPARWRGMTLRLLQFLLHSDGPMKISAVVDLVAIRVDSTPAFDFKYRMPDSQEVMRFCSSLVKVVTHSCGKLGRDHSKEVVCMQLAHVSVREYLLANAYVTWVGSGLNESLAKQAIADLCLKYILSLDSGIHPIMIKILYPLASYATRFWPLFARFCDSIDTIWVNAMALFANKDLYITCHRLWAPEYRRDRRHGLFDGPCVPPLYYAAYYNMTEVVRRLLHLGADIHARIGYHETALFCASVNGHVEVVELLLDHGADINDRLQTQHCEYNHRSERHSPLSAAASKGHSNVVDLLIRRGADEAADGQALGLLLSDAARGNHSDVIDVLLARGAYMRVSKDGQNSPLQTAISRRNEEVVFSLASGSSYGDLGRFHLLLCLETAIFLGLGRTAPWLALALSRNRQAQSALLSLQTFNSGTLETAADRLLVGAYCDEPISYDSISSFFYQAARGGHTGMIRILLTSAVKIGPAHLHRLLLGAVAGASLETVEYLIQQGAPIDCMDAGCECPLLSAIQLVVSDVLNPSVVDLIVQTDVRTILETIAIRLLNAGARTNAKRGRFGGALHAAACSGSVELVLSLLAHNADARACSGKYGTPMRAAKCCKHEDVYLALVDHVERGGRALQSENGTRITLVEASERGFTKSVKRLLRDPVSDEFLKNYEHALSIVVHAIERLGERSFRSASFHIAMMIYRKAQEQNLSTSMESILKLAYGGLRLGYVEAMQILEDCDHHYRLRQPIVDLAVTTAIQSRHYAVFKAVIERWPRFEWHWIDYTKYLLHAIEYDEFTIAEFCIRQLDSYSNSQRIFSSSLGLVLAIAEFPRMVRLLLRHDGRVDTAKCAAAEITELVSRGAYRCWRQGSSPPKSKSQYIPYFVTRNEAIFRLLLENGATTDVFEDAMGAERKHRFRYQLHHILDYLHLHCRKVAKSSELIEST